MLLAQRGVTLQWDDAVIQNSGLELELHQNDLEGL